MRSYRDLQVRLKLFRDSKRQDPSRISWRRDTNLGWKGNPVNLTTASPTSWLRSGILSGSFRGFFCHSCWVSLGSFEGSPAYLVTPLPSSAWPATFYEFEPAVMYMKHCGFHYNFSFLLAAVVLLLAPGRKAPEETVATVRKSHINLYWVNLLYWTSKCHEWKRRPPFASIEWSWLWISIRLR